MSASTCGGFVFFACACIEPYDIRALPCWKLPYFDMRKKSGQSQQAAKVSGVFAPPFLGSSRRKVLSHVVWQDMLGYGCHQCLSSFRHGCSKQSRRSEPLDVLSKFSSDLTAISRFP